MILIIVIHNQNLNPENDNNHNDATKEDHHHNIQNPNSEVKRNGRIFNLTDEHKRWNYPHWKSKGKTSNTQHRIAGLEFVIIDPYLEDHPRTWIRG